MKPQCFSATEMSVAWWCVFIWYLCSLLLRNNKKHHLKFAFAALHKIAFCIGNKNYYVLKVFLNNLKNDQHHTVWI